MGRFARGNEENEGGDESEGEFGQNKRKKQGEKEKDELLMDVAKSASNRFNLTRAKAATRKNDNIDSADKGNACFGQKS